MAHEPMLKLFEDKLGELVDDYLMLGVEPNDIVRILNYEAANDYEERLGELLRQKTQGSDEYSPTVKRVMQRFEDRMAYRRAAQKA
jgi:hypothetical protein